MLTTMEFEGLKGRTGSVTFDRHNLILGPNGSGKSALLLGVAYAATGKTPMSDKSGAILAYSADGKVAVACTLESGFKWRRRCAQNEYTKAVTNSVVIDTNKRLKLREAEAELSKHVGNFAPMFNVGNFLSMRPEQRREFVLDLLSGPESEAALGITAKLESAKEALGDASAELKGLTASVRDMTSRKNAAPQSTGNREELTARLTETESKLADVNTRIGKASGLKTAKRKLKAQLDESVKENARVNSDATSMRAESPKVEAWKSELAKYEKVAAEPIPNEIDVSEVDMLRREQGSLAGQLDELARAKAKAASELSEAEVSEAKESTILLVNADWKTVKDILDTMEPSEGGQKILAIAQSKLEGYDALAEKVEGLRARIVSLKKQGDNFSSEHSKGSDAIAASHWKIEECRVACHGADKLRTAKIQEVSAARAKAVTLASDITVFANRLGELTERGKVLSATCIDLEKQLNELDIDGGESDEALADQKTDLETHAKELKELVERRKEADDAVANLAQVTAKMHESESAVEKAKQLVEATRKERDDALGEMMSPILNGIADFCGEPCYCNLVNERGTAIFEIGVRRDGIEIPMDALSGGERAMYCVGLIVAMTKYADQAEKFLLIEAAELDAVNFAALAERIKTKAPDFQAFLATVDAPLGLPGWTVHNQGAVAV